MSDEINVSSLLFSKQYGGLSTAHETRKSCFLALAPRFLSELAAKLGVSGQIDKNPEPKRGSGTVSLLARQLHLQISEDPKLRDGLILRYRIGPAEGEATREGTVRMTELKEEGAVRHLVHQLRTALTAAKHELH